MKRLGLDIGSAYMGTVLLENDQVVSATYTEHGGDVHGALKEILDSKTARNCNTVGITGVLAGEFGLTLDSTLCVIEGARFLAPDSRNIFSLGAQHFMLCLYGEGGAYKEHSTNPPCASGTGSFIEQQARRLNISVPELCNKALAYKGEVPGIATRCAVFAKSDIIHAMQEGYSLDAVCAGLCEGITRTIAESLLKGRTLHAPVAVVGGMSLNRKIMLELERLMGISVTVPRYGMVCGAVGAALLGQNGAQDYTGLFTEGTRRIRLRKPLELRLSPYPDFDRQRFELKDGVEILSPAENPDGPAGGNAAREAGGGFAQAAAGNDVIRKPGSQAEYRGLYLGLDIGSTSTKAVLIDRGKRLVKGFYTRTGGRPVDAVLLLVRLMRDFLNRSPYVLAGAAATGSGRKMIKTLFGADLEINEITAHALAAVALYPQVDTIIEIGGQDSKFTLLRDGRVYYSHMNYVCAAGTGSFIEEQARLLHLDLGDFSAAALGSQAPHTSDRCTVYMERDLAELRGRGFSRRALAAAVLFSVRDNYLAKVVNKSAIGEHIVFQGATARNKALVAAFEQIVEKPIHVSPYCHLTGALGAALYCAKKNIQKSGFVFEQDEILIQDETCSLCSNRCLLKVARVGGNISAWGMKCGREYADRKPRSAAPDNTPGTRFHAALSGDIRPSAQDLQGGRPALHPQNSRPAIMILDALYNLEYNHLWRDVLCGLGFEVEIIRSSAASIALGRELVNSDFCAPIVVAHGLLKQALERGSGPIFLPALIREREEPAKTEPTFREKTGDCYFCYYSQYLPTVLSNLTSVRIGNRFVSPLLGLGPGRERDTAVRIFTALRQAFPDFPGLSADRVEEEFHRAYETFTANRRRLARGFLGGSPSGPNEFTVILLGRPYVLFDQALNLALPVKFAEYGALVYSMYEIDPPIPLQGHARKYYEAMHWNYGRRILRCAEYSAQRENTFVVFLSCFRCSPDSFLLSYVKDIMTHYRKPFLLLQLDEHILDTGYTTRIEAAMETFRNYRRERARKRKTGADGAAVAENRHTGVDVAGAVFEPGDNVLIPYINNLISGFWADCFENAGFSARVLESSKRDLLTGYRYANGGECMPAVAIVGGAIETVERLGLEPGRTCLYIPTVCMACNFPQFPVLADMAFTAAGLHGLKVARINSMNQGEYLPGNLPMKIFEAGVLGSLLYKLYFRVAPYETRKGSTGRALERSQELLGRAFRQGNDVRAAFKETCELFHGIERNEKDGRKTRIGILGDFYVKYNEAVNQNLQELIQSHDAELIIPSFSELTFHFFDADAEIDPNEGRHLKILRLFEQRYEKMAGVLLEGQAEPNWRECVQLMREYGLLHYLPGETSITCARALYSIKHRCVDGIVHVNPMFCCPGVVSSSIFRKIQQDFGIPVVDLFYDGTGRPNHMLIPHLHYLKRRNT